MKINYKNPKHWALLCQQAVYTLIAVGVRFFRGAPARPSAILYGHQLSGNLKALYTEWAKAPSQDIDLYFLSLDPDYSAALKESGIKVLQCNRLKDMLMLSEASAFISDHGLHAMSPLVRLTDILFIDVWHGIPFKGFIKTDFQLLHRYDEIWVSSNKLKFIYQEKFGFSEDRLKVLGYARVDRLVGGEQAGSNFKTQASVPPGAKIVLYAPTWQHDDQGRQLFPFGESSVSFIEELADICEAHNAILIVRSHLNTQIQSKQHEYVRFCSQRDYPDTEDILLCSDILICDWSSIAFDYLALNRPTIFLDVPPPFKNGLTLGREYRFGKIADTMQSLSAILETCLESPSAYHRDQSEIHQKIISELYGSNTDGLVARRQLNRLESLVHKRL